uniref:Transmembrane protein 35A n=1 Tax=Noctiluca scintillans TaxID=2966 RepID=A0A7S1AY63_NOCSC|mmetsp:Transcript_64816/g.171564  ORF Transcript_64816/g.171564 Transcript_64816/m.171564 type:complete len:142 (+) Transcript_64816:65-490(+)
MPHGDFSDLAALMLIAGGCQQIFKPEMQFAKYHPFKPFFDIRAASMTVELEAMIKFCGGFMVILGCMLFTVRWNTINGKMSGLALILAAANSAHTAFKLLDKEVFVPRPFYIYSAVMALTGLKLMFFANPIIKAETGKKAK